MKSSIRFVADKTYALMPELHEHNGVVFVDFACFDINRPEKTRFSEHLFRLEVIANMRGVKILCVASNQDLEGSGAEFIGALEKLAKFITNFEDEESIKEIIKSFSIVVTGYQKRMSAEEAQRKKSEIQKARASLEETKARLLRTCIEEEVETHTDIRRKTRHLREDEQTLFQCEHSQDVEEVKKAALTKISRQMPVKAVMQIKTAIADELEKARDLIVSEVSKELLEVTRRDVINAKSTDELSDIVGYIDSLDQHKDENETLGDFTARLAQKDGVILEQVRQNIKEISYKLEFLYQNLPEAEKELVSLQQSWQNYINSEIAKIKLDLVKLIQPPMITIVAGDAEFKGYFVTIKDISEFVKAYSESELKSLEVYASLCFNANADLALPGVSLRIETTKFFIPNEVTMDLSGKDGEQEQIASTTPSTNGKPGEPGESGGNYLVVAAEFIGLDNLTVISNGGKGGNGQNGSN